MGLKLVLSVKDSRKCRSGDRADIIDVYLLLYSVIRLTSIYYNTWDSLGKKR